MFVTHARRNCLWQNIHVRICGGIPKKEEFKRPYPSIRTGFRRNQSAGSKSRSPQQVNASASSAWLSQLHGLKNWYYMMLHGMGQQLGYVAATDSLASVRLLQSLMPSKTS